MAAWLWLCISIKPVGAADLLLVFQKKEIVLERVKNVLTKVPFINFLLNLQLCIDKKKEECYIYLHKLLALNMKEC